MKPGALAVALVFFGMFLIGAREAPKETAVPQMTKEELKAKLGSKDIIVIDVRLDEQWRFSNRKIPGAVHENPAITSTWMDKYPKNKTIVFY